MNWRKSSCLIFIFLDWVIFQCPRSNSWGLTFYFVNNNLSAGLSISHFQLNLDDSKLYRRADSIEQCQLFENDISALFHWFTSWQLKINFEKCQTLQLGGNGLEYQYTVNELIIFSKEFYDDQGVCVDYRLSFHRHCSNFDRNTKLFFRPTIYLSPSLFLSIPL